MTATKTKTNSNAKTINHGKGILRFFTPFIYKVSPFVIIADEFIRPLFGNIADAV